MTIKPKILKIGIDLDEMKQYNLKNTNLNNTNFLWKKYVFNIKVSEKYGVKPKRQSCCYPWWCVRKGNKTATIVMYLPTIENLYEFWDNAYNIDYTLHKEIIFTDEFPKPIGFRRKKLQYSEE